MAEKENQVNPCKQSTVDELIDSMQLLPTESRDQFTYISSEAKRQIEVHYPTTEGVIIGYVVKWAENGILWIKEPDSDNNKGKLHIVPNEAPVQSRIIKLED